MAQSWITATHPLYDTYAREWTLLQEAYRGDGGFLDGTNLIAYPREIIYKTDASGNLTTEIDRYQDKFTRRKALARYENFARAIIDTFNAHLFSKTIQRDAEAVPELAAWWENVDGAHTHLGDWMPWSQALAFVYGHVLILMDRANTETQPRTKAEQGRPVLRCYTPLDVLDWIWEDGRFTALKVIEANARGSLDERATTGHATRGDGAPASFSYVVWDETRWTRYRDDGTVTDSGEHGFGRVPVVIHRARIVPGQPYLGASILGDPKVHRDLYNLISEKRELLRSQTFSMLNVQLGQDEDLGEAKARLGTRASVETVLWSKGAADFIAPPSGPANDYQAEIDSAKRTIYRMAGLPWDGDSASAESADSRRIKAMDLNRLLAGYADECERVEWALAKLWLTATTGQTDPGAITTALQDVTIHYPDEFATIDITQGAADVRDVLTMGLGPTAVRLFKERAIPIILPDISEDDTAQITTELQAQATAMPTPGAAASAFAQRIAQAAPQPPAGIAGLANGTQAGGQLQDAQG